MNKPRLTHRISRAALILVFALFSATPAWASVITLNSNTGEVTLQNGDVLTGTGGWNTHVKIADGATVTLSGVNITAYYNTTNNKRPGITCLGNATIILAEGTTNDVAGGNSNPGIHVSSNKTLTLQGSGTLNATGGWGAAGIGSGYVSSCGNITISGGFVTATGGDWGAGIGSGNGMDSYCGTVTISGGIVNANGGYGGAGIGSGSLESSCGDITISGGTVIATGGDEAAGIGSGGGANSYSTCGDITISGGTVTATGGDWGAGIGSGSESSCRNITISGGFVTANGGLDAAGIGSGWESSCSNITISGGTVNANGGDKGAGIGSGFSESSCENITISGGIVTANGGEEGAGIGSGYGIDSSCGTVTITNDVIMVTATAGQDCSNAIGAGTQSSTCGTVTIGGVETGFITESPFTYNPNLVTLVTLTPQSGEVTLQNGDVLTGTGGENTRVKIAAGATVVLFNVNITAIPDDNSHGWAGITCLGDAVIVLYQGTANDVKGGKFGSSIFVPQGHTLTLQGSGTLNATGGSFAAGIGSGLASTCGNIILSGGIINATGGSSCAGIGSGYWNASCESITITNGVTMVTATAGQDCDNAIGAGDVSSTCGTITIGGVETGFITESPFTTYPYTVSFDANGGSGTMADMGFMYGVAQNLTANSFTNWGHSFDGWTTSANGPKVYDDGQSVSNLAETSGATVTLYAKWITDISVNGDEYTIHTPTGWDDFCDLLADNSNGYFTGKTVKLDADISVTRMAGSSGHEFSGTFDGQGHTLTVSYQNNNGNVRTAPFSYVNGATIQNLIVAGTITGTASRAAGIVGETGSSLSHVTNCVSSVNVSGGSYIGGISVGGNLEITGCLFDGTINGANMSGGFVGYSNSALVISDCLFAPQEGSSIVGGTFYYNGGGEITPVNSYYTVLLGTAQGHPAVSDPDMTPMGTPTGTYPVSGLTAYANGLMYGDTFYYDPDFVLPFVQTDTDEYTIYTATGWHLFCDALQDNDTYNRFIGKTVKLDADISVTRMAGSSHHDFMGTFDGQGHTLTIAYGTSESPFSEEYAAPFRNVETGAVIHSLKVEGHIYTSNKYAAGIVGNQYGTVAVSDCRSSVVIHSSKNGDGTHGGIVANVHAILAMSGCVYDGRMLTTNGTTLCGGLVGWCGSICAIRDCLYAPDTEVAMAPGETAIDDGATFLRYNSDGANTPANSYYTEPLGTAQGYPAASDPAIQPSGDPTGTYPVSGLTAYANGLLCGDTFYHNPGATQTVALSSGWNWVSLNLEVTLNDLRAALMAALPSATNIIVNSQGNGNTTYNGSTWRGSLNTMDVAQMYKIQVPSSCQITLEGTPVDPAGHPVTIHDGVNWIGFPLGASKTLADAFADFAVSGDMVKSQNGQSTYNGSTWRGSLTTLEPGKGYMYKSASIDPRVLMFGPHYVDLGLPSGLLWATCNVGADTPEARGDYFMWGETQLKGTCHWTTYQYCMGSDNTLTKYCNDSSYGYNGFTDDLTVLLPEDDAATANWGGGWRIPTQEEWQELYSNTTVTWTTQNGVNGRLFTAENGNSLFLPVAGCRTASYLFNARLYGYYCSSSLNTGDPRSAWYFCFGQDSYSMGCYWARDTGFTVRPVREN